MDERHLMQNITTADELIAIQNCTNLIVQYTHYIDLGQTDKVWELFSNDGIWEMPAANLRFEGREQLKSGISANLSGATWLARHICTNTLVELTGPDTAQGLTYMINYRHYFDHPIDAAADVDRELAPIGPVRHIGEYIDRFVRTEYGWRFAHRRTRLAFSYRA